MQTPPTAWQPHTNAIAFSDHHFFIEHSLQKKRHLMIR
jgi:hypothetical protein